MNLDVDKAVVTKDILQNIIDNIDYNKTIVEYYKRFVEHHPGTKFSRETLNRNTERLKNCNSIWSLDKYEQQKVKDFIRTNLCRDKFCANCKKVRQASRMAKYIPTLEKYKDNLYHLVLTVPNCLGNDLNATYKHMAKCFAKFVRYLNGDAKIKDIDFSSWGYQGAIRSLEITFHGDIYHPHFHVGLVLDPNVLGKKNITNTYSYDFKKAVPELRRLFSKQEILIQKIWYLLINNIKVNKKNIDNIKSIRKKLKEKNIDDIGYSCSMDKFRQEDFAELFKYMTKEKDEKGQLLTYENFKTLYINLYRVKQIQGYGCLYRIDDNIDMEEFASEYERLIDLLRQKERPGRVYEKPQDLFLDNQYKLISRKSYYKYLRTIINDND